jgi:hypothetical protein
MIALVGTVLPKVPEPDMYGDHRELIPSSPRTCTCALASDISLRGRADRWSGRRVDLVSRRQRVQASRMRRRVMMSAPARAMNASLVRGADLEFSEPSVCYELCVLRPSGRRSAGLCPGTDALAQH